MKTRAICLSIVTCVFISDFALAAEEAFLQSQPGEVGQEWVYEHKEVVEPAMRVGHEELTKSSIRDQVKSIRQERYDKMPYLDRGFIREAISEGRVNEKINFVTSGEKTLKDLIARAIRVHTPTRAARERISLAKRRIMAAVRELFPEIGVEYEDREGLLTTGIFNSRSYQFEIRQPIFRGGVLWNTMLQEQEDMRAAEKEFDSIIGQVVKEIAEAYFEYNRSLQVTVDQAETIGRMERYHDLSKQKFAQELISDIEHLNVESLFSQMTYDNETAKQELALSQLDMQNLLDLGIEDSLAIARLYDVEDLLAQDRVDSDAGRTWVEGAEEEFNEAAQVPELTELVDLAYEHRPELQVEAAKLRSARLEERIRWGELLPQADVVLEMGQKGEALDAVALHPKKGKEFRLFLELNWNMAGSTVNYQFENDEQAASVSTFAGGGGTQTTRNTISVDLFDGLDALAEIKEAEIAKLDQIVELENAEKEIIQDVKQAYFDYQKAIIQVKSSLKRLDYRERLARLAKHRLENNEVQISEYMQAEIDLLQEKLELHQALKDYFTAKSNLNSAVGIKDYFPIEEFYGE